MSGNKAVVVWIVAIVLVAALPYIPSLRGQFALDDTELILRNPVSHSLANIGQAFGTYFLYGFVDAQSLYYRPLITISYQLNYALSGPHAFAFRLTNIVLYVLCSVLMFIVARVLLGNVIAAGAAGIAFAVLPSHAESVAWISGRTDIIATILMLLSFLAFVAAYHRRPAFSWPLAALCGLLFGLALISKESALVLPVLLALYVLIYGESMRRAELLRWAAVFMVPFAVYTILRHSALHGALSIDFCYMLKERLLRVGIVQACYLRMLFIPLELRVFYDSYLPDNMTASAAALGGWLVPIGLAVVTAAARKKLPIAAFCAGWILISILPNSDLLPTNRTIPPYERFVFTASVGSSLILGWLFWRLWRFRPSAVRVMPVAVATIGIACIVYCASLTIFNSQIYFSNLGWARYVAQTKPRFALLRASAAWFLARAGDLPTAAEEYEAVIDLGWGDFDREQRARLQYELGVVRAAMGNYRKAAKAFAEAVSWRPDFGKAWRNLGRVELQLGRYRKAVTAYEHAAALIELSPRDISNLAKARARAGRP